MGDHRHIETKAHNGITGQKDAKGIHGRTTEIDSIDNGMQHMQKWLIT